MINRGISLFSFIISIFHIEQRFRHKLLCSNFTSMSITLMWVLYFRWFRSIVWNFTLLYRPLVVRWMSWSIATSRNWIIPSSFRFCILLLYKWISYWPLSWIQCLLLLLYWSLNCILYWKSFSCSLTKITLFLVRIIMRRFTVLLIWLLFICIVSFCQRKACKSKKINKGE